MLPPSIYKFPYIFPECNGEDRVVCEDRGSVIFARIPQFGLRRRGTPAVRGTYAYIYTGPYAAQLARDVRRDVCLVYIFREGRKGWLGNE